MTWGVVQWPCASDFIVSKVAIVMPYSFQVLAEPKSLFSSPRPFTGAGLKAWVACETVECRANAMDEMVDCR